MADWAHERGLLIDPPFIGSAIPRRSRRGGKLYQFTWRGPGPTRSFQASHHPGQLDSPVLVNYLDHTAGGDLPVVRLHHHVVPIRESGDLREVGDDDDLTVL